MSKVFISYSWDSDEHKRWVRKLSDELNSAGIETILDQKDMVLGDYITHFMEKSISKSDYVLLILTPRYKERADNRQSGVGYEEQIMTAEVNELNNHRKYIPVLREGTWGKSTPTWAKGKLGVDFTTVGSFRNDWPVLVNTIKGGIENSVVPASAPTSCIIMPQPIIPVKRGGRVAAVGDNEYGQCNVNDWTDIVHIAAGEYHTVGLTSDGSVVAVGRNNHGQCNVSDWTDIVDIAAGCRHTVGLKSDGSVVAVGDNFFNQCRVEEWKEITALSAGYYYTVGLRRDGRVVAIGDNEYAKHNTNGWPDIAAVSAGFEHTVGLKKDGTVVAVGYNRHGQLKVNGWRDIIAAAAGFGYTAGLKKDGTVVITDNIYKQSWTDITAIAAGSAHLVGLKKDGTVVAVGDNSCGQCNVENWRNITAIAACMSHTVGIVGE